MPKHLARRTKDGKATKYIVSDEAELNALGTQLGLDSQTLSNLRQLCNFDGRLEIGKDRSKKKKVVGWQLLEDVVFLQKDGTSLLEPAIGSVDWVHKTVPGLSDCMKDTSLGKLMAPSGRTWTGGWTRLQRTPAIVWQLGQGASLRINKFSGSASSDGSVASQVCRRSHNLNSLLCTWLITVQRPFAVPLCGEGRTGRMEHECTL